MLLGGNIIFGGKRGGIPSGWVEVEYLESTGTQYIDTGVIPTSEIIFRTSASFSQSYTTYGYRLFGSGSPTASPNMSLCAQYGEWTLWFGPLWIRSNTKIVVGEKRLCEVGDKYISIDGERTQISNPGVYPAASCYIFALNSTATPTGATGFVKAKVYSFEAVNATTGENIRSFVPVRDAVTNEGAMCDVLTGEIYHNAGSGAFVVGPDKALPYDYEVEWLQSDGTAYVDTDLDFSGFGLEQLPLLSSTGLVSFESVADITANNSRAYGFGYSVAIYHGARMYVGQGKKYPDSSNWVNNRFYTTGYSLEENNANAVEFSISTNAAGKQSTRVAIGVCENGSFTQIKAITAANAATSTGVTNSGMKFCLLGLNRNGSPIYTQTSSNTRLHRLSVVYDGIPIGSFIPVVKDGIGYFYDGITGKLYGNSAASGALIIGPRLA